MKFFGCFVQRSIKERKIKDIGSHSTHELFCRDYMFGNKLHSMLTQVVLAGNLLNEQCKIRLQFWNCIKEHAISKMFLLLERNHSPAVSSRLLWLLFVITQVFGVLVADLVNESSYENIKFCTFDLTNQWMQSLVSMDGYAIPNHA